MTQEAFTLVAPTPANYKEWYAARLERTKKVIAKQKSITGLQCRQQNLSLKLIYLSGYRLNFATDTLEKQDE